MAVLYTLPQRWIRYDVSSIQTELTAAKVAILTLRNFPYQREWVESMQEMELKREVAGTSRIEGAEFTKQELDQALQDTPEALFTRSQRQARAAKNTYKWIATVEEDRPVGKDIVLEIHRRIVTGADDDHCPPGRIREEGHNVTFGIPRHRGAHGGQECTEAFNGFTNALSGTFQEHDPIIQAMAAHYHLAAMHPFLDGNGRTARALEALMLQRAGLRDTCFIAMSNYYYDEKNNYLEVLAQTRGLDHDLTPFLRFALNGLALQAARMLGELRIHVKKALFRNMMYDTFKHLQSKRKRVLAERQLEILKILLKRDRLVFLELVEEIAPYYGNLKNKVSALFRDITGLETIGAVRLKKHDDHTVVKINLDWPTQMTETDALEKIKQLPKAKTSKFLP